MEQFYNPFTKEFENVGGGTTTSASALRKEGRLSQYGYNTEPEKNILERTLNLKPNRSVIENLLELLPRTESFSANLLGGTLLRGDDLGTSWQKAKDALKGENKLTYTQLLKEAGFKDNFGTKATGFLLGTALDPATYIPAGKIIGKGMSIGRTIPGIKSVIGLGDNVLGAVQKAVGWNKIADTGLQNFDTLMRGGASGRTNYELSQMIKKYEPLLTSMAKINPDERLLVGKAIENKDLIEKLSPEARDLMDLIKNMFSETGIQKKTAGTVKGLIGENLTVKEATENLMDLISRGDLDNAKELYKIYKKEIQLPNFKNKKAVQAALAGKVPGLKGGWMVKEADDYLPHLFTDEFREYSKLSGKTPEEMIELMKGMSRRNIAKVETSRSLLGNIAEYNAQSRKLFNGIDMFESDINKIIPKYMYNSSKNNALLELGSEVLKLTDDSGKALIRSIGDKGKVPVGMVKLTGLPFEKGYYTTPEIARQINAVNGILTSDVQLNKFIKKFDKGMNIWKKMVTAYSPTFTPNNLIGGELNMWTRNADSLSSDTFSSVMDIVNKNPIKIVAENGKKITGEKLYEIAQKSGALVGQISAEDKLKRGVLAGIDDTISKMGFNAEKIMRMQTMVSQFKKTGDVMDAVRETWKVHGNYNPESMSTFERTILKRGIPFINWAKTNIPFQISSLYNRTGKYAQIARVQNEMVSPEERETLPKYLRNQILLPGKSNADGTKSYRSIGVPLADLNKVDPMHPVKSFQEIFLNQANPFLKAPLELAFNKNLFYDQQIVDKSVPPNMQKATAPELIARLAEKVPAIGKAIGYQKTSTVSDITGKEKTKKEMNATLAYIINQLGGPIGKYANLPKSIEKEKITEGGSIWPIMSSIFNPIKVNQFDPKEQEYYSQKEEEERLQNMINFLIQRGLIPKLK